MKKTNKKLDKIKSIIPFILLLIIGFVCGVVGAKTFSLKGMSTGEELYRLALVVVDLYIAMFLQIIIHEGGHLIFGLLTGYKFSSFRIGNFMFIKREGKIKLKRFSIAGTGGQCLLIPPDMKEGKIPYVLYNLGGVIANIITAIIFMIIAVIFEDNSILFLLSFMLAIFGVFYAILNGVPAKVGQAQNDGRNTLSIGKMPEAMKAFWIQMKINEKIASGMRLKDMPEEWFEIPSEEDMKNSMVAANGVFACSRLMDEMKFEEADETINRLFSMDNEILEIHRILLVMDQIYCEIVGNNNKDRLEKLLDKQQKKYMRVMSKYPSVMRTEYVYTLLVEHDEKKASEIMKRFEKVSKTYPYKNEVENERELINYAISLLERRR